MRMGLAIASLLVGGGSLLLGGLPAWGQASEIQSAAPTTPAGQTQAQHGRELLDQMVAAMGGDAWLHRSTMTMTGRTAQFFRSQPTGVVVEYQAFRQMANAEGRPEMERIEFITAKGMILPGTKRDVVQVWTADNGYELTYKGVTPLPRDQVDDYLRRRNHSIEAVVERWLKAPGVEVVSEGTTMVERHIADRVSVLSATNDAVTIDLDATTHLPLSRTFEWRNEQFKDHDEDREDYDDWHVTDGIPTALTLTRYRNGDMISQRFLTKVEYNKVLPVETFDPKTGLKRK